MGDTSSSQEARARKKRYFPVYLLLLRNSLLDAIHTNMEILKFIVINIINVNIEITFYIKLKS